MEVKPGTALQVRVHISDHEAPIQVSQAIVRWVRSYNFGCEFVNLSPEDWARLNHVVKDLEMQPFERERQDREVA